MMDRSIIHQCSNIESYWGKNHDKAGLPILTIVLYYKIYSATLAIYVVNSTTDFDLWKMICVSWIP